MHELIRSNQRKSAALILLLLALLVGLGWAVGFLLSPPATTPMVLPDVERAAPVHSGGFLPPYSLFGVGLAIVIWSVLLGVAFAGGEQLLLAQAGAKEVTKREAPRLVNLVEEMQLASGLRAMPRIYLINSPVPNAFAVGRTPERAAVAVTTGLMAKLNRDELQGVIAHEMAHIANRDTLFMTLAGVTVGAIVMVADLMRHTRFAAYGGRRDRDSGQGQAVLLVLSLLLMVLAPILAQMLYFACSRRREYLADACGAKFTRYPEGLASALEKISRGQVAEEEHSRVLAPMYIVSPLAGHGAAGLFGTHPPIEDRVRILRSMGGGASLAAYQQAYAQQHGGAHAFRVLPGDDAGLPVRSALVGDEAAEHLSGLREAKHSLHAVGGLRVIDCTCGLRMKLPPGFTPPTVTCPRCRTVHALV